MGLRRDDLRPLQQMLRSELANLHAGATGSIRIEIEWVE